MFQPNPSPLDDEVVVDRFLSRDRDGASARVLAAEFGVSTRTVLRWRARLEVQHGLPRDLLPNGERARPVADHERARMLLDDGCSLAETARTVGVSTKTLRNWFPDVRAWSKREAAEYARLMRHLGEVA